MQRRAPAHARPMQPSASRRPDPSRSQDPRRSSAGGSERTRASRATTAGTDVARLAPAAASAVFPGLGQLVNRRLRLALWFAGPALALLLLLGLALVAGSPARLLASIVAPRTMGLLLALNALVLALRLVSVWHAFFDRRHRAGPGRVGMAGLAVLTVAVVLPHSFLNAWGASASGAFTKIFATEPAGPGAAAAAVDPGSGRVNVLVVGVDSAPWRGETLTDSLMVASLDPVGKTATLLSLPRDIVGVPLPGGGTFGLKINALMSYAAAHPKEFPQGGMRTLEDAVGQMLGISIHYYARIDFTGFVKLVDAIGGVDVDVRKGFVDPQYDGYGFPGYDPIHAPTGWSVTPGPHHFDGVNALAYARSRYAVGESDFTRAARQQEILLAIRHKLLSNGTLLVQLPALFDALGNLVRTDVPAERLPELVAVADEIGPAGIAHAVLDHPLVVGANDPRLGSIQKPDLPAIRAFVATLFPAPGTPPAGVTAAPSVAPAP